MPSEIVVVVMSAMGDGTTFNTAMRSFDATALSTASVSELRPLCDTPMMGCSEAGKGIGNSPALRRLALMPRARSAHTAEAEAA